MNEAKGRTTAKGGAYRLLLVGLALLLRQAWVWLSGQAAAAQRLGRREWAAALPLRAMLSWLADAVRRNYREGRAIPLGRPVRFVNLETTGLVQRQAPASVGGRPGSPGPTRRPVPLRRSTKARPCPHGPRCYPAAGGGAPCRSGRARA